MKEKVKVRLAEIDVWSAFVDNLDFLQKDAQRDIDNYTAELADMSPDDRATDWRQESIAGLNVKLAALTTVFAAVQKHIG